MDTQRLTNSSGSTTGKGSIGGGADNVLGATVTQFNIGLHQNARTAVSGVHRQNMLSTGSSNNSGGHQGKILSNELKQMAR